MTAPIEDAMHLDAITEVTWTQLVSASGLPESELRELVRYGALVPRDPDAPAWTFEARWLVVARRPRASATTSSSIRTPSASSCATSSGLNASKRSSARCARNWADHRRKGAARMQQELLL